MPFKSSEFMVGLVHNPNKDNRIDLVVGHEFHDSPGFYWWYLLGSRDHFRKRPDKFDDVHPVSVDVYRSLQEA